MKEVRWKPQMLLVCLDACGWQLESSQAIESPAVVETFGDVALDLLFIRHTKIHRLVTPHLIHEIGHVLKSESSIRNIFISVDIKLLLDFFMMLIYDTGILIQKINKTSKYKWSNWHLGWCSMLWLFWCISDLDLAGSHVLHRWRLAWLKNNKHVPF